MLYSQGTMQATLDNLNEATAMRMIALAGNTGELETLITRLARNFNVTVKPSTLETLQAASKRFHLVSRHRHVNYKVA